MRISAIICTHNRSAYLKSAIQSLAEQTLPKDRYEVIVVDNASTDDTKAVVESFAHLRNLRYIHEPVLGLSQARNTGWHDARGEYIAFLDDDAIACPEWLERIVGAFDTVKPTPGSVGGRVIPVWEAERPAWLPKDMEPALTIVDWAEKPIFLTESQQFLAGANVAYPRAILETVKGFSVNLGRKGTSLLSGEEYLIQRYLIRSGLGVYYDPLICVEHHIPAQRLTTRWLCRRYFWQGVTQQIIQFMEISGEVSQINYLWQAVVNFARFARSPVSLAALVAPVNSPVRMKIKCNSYGHLGGVWGQVQIGLGRVTR
jgi:glucosyl-dolichyl phosphate glucuronosyltransferase